MTMTTAKRQQSGRQWALDERHEAATRDAQRLPHLLLHHVPQHHAEDHRRRLEAEFRYRVSEEPEHGHDDDIERGAVDREYPDETENDDRGNSSRYGTCTSRTQIPMSGRLMTSSIRLPSHMEAISPQKRSGLELMT